SSKIGTSISALDLLARVYLAQGELDKCEEILGPAMSGRQYSTYETRWAALTRAKLLYRQGQLGGAMKWLKTITTGPNEINDRFFAATCHLVMAYILGHTDNGKQCAQELVRADTLGATQNRELQGQFNYLMGRLISADLPGFGRSLQDRGKRIWASQGVVSLS